MGKESDIKRYGKIVVLEHWLAMIFVLILSITSIFLLRDWFVHEFHIYGAEMYISTPDFASDLHKYAAYMLLIVGAIHMAAHAGQKEKPILPKRSFLELKSALYSLMFLVFLARKQERGSGEKYLKSQRIMYAFTIYVLGLAAITGFLYLAEILEEQMLIAHVISGILVLLVVVHHVALVIRKRDKVALRSVLATGTMPKWYVKKNHRLWYYKVMGEKPKIKPPKKSKPKAPQSTKKSKDKKPSKKSDEKPPAPSTSS